MRTASIGMPFAAAPGLIDLDRSGPRFSLSQWAEFYYRVRRWNYEVTIASNPGGPFTTWSGIFRNLQTSSIAAPLNEQQIYNFRATAGEANIGDESYRVEWQWDAAPLISGDRQTYVPLINFWVRPPDVEIYTIQGTAPGDVVQQPFVATLMGVECAPFYGSDAIGLWYGSLTVTPIEYWERRRADNTLPIWHATTGAKLLATPQFDELP